MGNVYREHGYKDRKHYLECLAEEHKIDKWRVFALGDILGPGEDFDGLVTALQDESE